MKGISCLCVTYSRVELLEESIECFLRQTYKGPKELIIINDCDDQILEYDHPEVVIFNTSRRFRSLGEKRDTSVALSKYDWLAIWDDDDIFLPHRLEFSMNKINENNLDYYKLGVSFSYDMNSGIKKITNNTYFSASIFSRRLYETTSGHGYTNFGEDKYIEEQMFNNKKYKHLIEKIYKKGSLIKEEDIYYFYRFSGIPGHATSCIGKDDELGWLEKMRKKGKRKTGKIKLNPHWDKDYINMSNEFIKNNKHK